MIEPRFLYRPLQSAFDFLSDCFEEAERASKARYKFPSRRDIRKRQLNNIRPRGYEYFVLLPCTCKGTEFSNFDRGRGNGICLGGDNRLERGILDASRARQSQTDRGHESFREHVENLG